MRIAIAGSKGVPGRHGVEVVVEELGARLASMGHEVTVFAWSGYPGGLTRWRGCSIEETPGPSSGALAMPVHSAGAFRRISRRLDSFDLVHVHSVDPLLLAGPVAGRLPLVATSHGRAYLVHGAGILRRAVSMLAEKRFLRGGHRATAVAAHLAAYYDSTAPGRVVHIPNGVRELGGRGGALPGRLGLADRPYAVFAAGRIIPSKGLHTLLEAWLLARPPELLVVAGPAPAGRYGERIASLARETGALFTGRLDSCDLGDLLRGARYGVQPSLVEAQSMSLLDMLSAGLAVAYSDIPGNREVAGGLGVPFSPGSPESLSDAISLVRAGGRPGPDALERLGAAHCWNRIAEGYLREYDAAVGPGR